MNESAKFLMKALIPLLLALLMAGCSPSAGGSSPPLEGARIGGPFTLINQDGAKVSDTDLSGRYRLVYFGYSFCPDVCPVDLALIAQGLRQFEKSDPERAARVQPIFITVDPERDTPQVLKQYVSAFHPRLMGLTGTPQEIAAAAKSFGVYYAKADAQEGSKDYLMDHSRVAVLLGPKGEPIALVPHDKGAEAVKAELDSWVV